MNRRRFMQLLGGVIGAIPGAAALASLAPASRWTSQYHVPPPPTKPHWPGVPYMGIDYAFDRQSYFVVIATRWHDGNIFIERAMQISEQDVVEYGGNIEALAWEKCHATA